MLDIYTGTYRNVCIVKTTSLFSKVSFINTLYCWMGGDSEALNIRFSFYNI